MTASTDRARDQARMPVFRALLGVQALATTVFGAIPLLIPGVFASATGYSGDDEVIYRLAGAATAGYLVAAVLALSDGVGWADLRIAIVATLTFTAAAVVGSAATLAAGDRHWVVFVVLAASVAFAAIAAYWLRRGEGAPADAGEPLGTVARGIVGLATIAAAVFGILPLLAPSAFASLVNLAGTDLWIYRMAGAACLGYAAAGVLELRAPGYRSIRIQNSAAIAFNGLSAIACWIAVASGTGGLLAPLIAVAATFFTFALGWLAVAAR